MNVMENSPYYVDDKIIEVDEENEIDSDDRKSPRYTALLDGLVQLQKDFGKVKDGVSRGSRQSLVDRFLGGDSVKESGMLEIS
jgi:hypothetical protein